jgi:late competence protein required for DNA uptake (superfamily II DNA/RNA helicase)
MDKRCSQCEQTPVFNKEANDERAYLCWHCLHGGKITEEEKILQRHNENFE